MEGKIIIKLDLELKESIEERAKALGLNMSAYLRMLAIKDMLKAEKGE